MYFDTTPVGLQFDRPKYLDHGFFRREARRQGINGVRVASARATSGHGAVGAPTGLDLVRGEHPGHVPVAEVVDRLGHLLDGHEVHADAERLRRGCAHDASRTTAVAVTDR